jgi:hypothetical protein
MNIHTAGAKLFKKASGNGGCLSVRGIRVIFVFRYEYGHITYAYFSVSVAAASGLGYCVEGAQGSQYEGKIDIHPSFDALCRYEAAMLLLVKSQSHFLKNCLPMGRAHVGREVEHVFSPRIDQLIKEVKSMAFKVHNAKHLVSGCDHFC